MLQVERATVSLPGSRRENQDRVEIITAPDALLLVVVDGMGGHSGGARAAETTLAVLRDCFNDVAKPVFDPQGFLTLSLARAHEAIVALGEGMALEQRPRATCAVCLVQDAGAYWAHVGDSRIYQIRDGDVHDRTRDHSHVELLLQEGRIAAAEVRAHPMRNFVECCLGGEAPLPDMSVTGFKRLVAGDVVMACTDGLWAGVDDDDLSLLGGEGALEVTLLALAEQAVDRNAPNSDNTTAAALRWPRTGVRYAA